MENVHSTPISVTLCEFKIHSVRQRTPERTDVEKSVYTRIFHVPFIFNNYLIAGVMMTP
jgi:hypothetical protein